MPNLQLKLKTWSCDTCGYKQDFEPTPELMRWHMVDGEPLSLRGKQWRIYAQHDWNKPTCPACLVTVTKANDLAEKKLVSTGKQLRVKALDTSNVPELTPELSKQSVASSLSDEEIDSAVVIDRYGDGNLRIQTAAKAQKQGRTKVRQINDIEKADKRNKTKVAIQELVDRGMLDETDLPTKKIKDNLALGKLADR